MNNIIKKRPKPILVDPVVTVDQSKLNTGVLLEIFLLYTGLLGYVFCNTTALDMNIPVAAVVAITAVCFALMILLVWYNRVFFGVLGGLAGFSLLAWKIAVPMYQRLWNSVVVCYNYTVYLLTSQGNYSNYLSYMTMDLTNILESPIVLQRHFYTAVIVFSLIASVFFALALFRRIPIIVSFLVPAVGLVPLFFFGIVPNYIAFSIFLSALIGCYSQTVVQQMSRRRNSKAKKGTNIRVENEKKPKKKQRLTTRERFAFAANHGSFGVVITVVMMAVTVGTASFIYSRPILQMDQVRQTLDNISETVMNTMFRSVYEKQLNVAGYMAPTETLSLQAPNWRNLKVATVKSRTDTPVYLRYRTTVDLEDSGWTVPDDAFMEDFETNVGYDLCEYTQYYTYLALTSPGGDPLKAGLDNIDSEEQGYITDQITVYPKYKASDLLGLPKGTTSQAPLGEYNDLEREADTLLRHNDDPKDRSYMYRVVSPVMTSNVFLTNFESTLQSYIALRKEQGDNDPYMSREADYSRFVYRRYLDLPKEAVNIVSDLAQEITEPYKTKLQKTQAIEQYFRNNYHYSMTRQRLSRADGTAATSTDYIYYFLFQNEKKEGYCTLFASSMVCMLRTLGIPARVVSGYYASPYMIDTDNYGTELLDNNYHAWVEVYFDGMGWIGFEPTPDLGEQRNYYLLEAIDAGEVLENPTVNIIYQEIPGYVRYSKELPDPTIIEEEQPLANTIVTALRLNSMSGVAKFVLKVILTVLLLVFVLFLGEYCHRRSVKSMLRVPPAEGVRRGYYLILRLMQLQNFKFFEGELLEDFAKRSDNLKLASVRLLPIVPILQRVLYSDCTVTEEERKRVADYVFALDKAAFRRANFFKAFWYKFTLKWRPSYKAMIWKFL